MGQFLQTTAAVIPYSMQFIGPVCFVLYFYILLFTDYYGVALLYLVYLVCDRRTCDRGGWSTEWVRNWTIWEFAANYYPISIIKTTELDPGKNYICGYHPHGFFAIGAATKFACGLSDLKKLFPGMTSYIHTASQLAWLPIEREVGLMLGCRSVSKESITWSLTKDGTGNMIILAIGGAVEALDAHPGTARLTLKTRKGFVRLAIKNGASLVPMFAFGENDVIRQFNIKPGSIVRWIQDRFRQITGLAMPLPRSVVPLKIPIDIVVGKPIDVVSNQNPTEDEVDYYHKLYVDNLVNLFDQHKINYDNYKTASMEIV